LDNPEGSSAELGATGVYPLFLPLTSPTLVFTAAIVVIGFELLLW
jgi:hypothetical protein